jgi:2'-5' RNA ligase
MVTNMRCFIGMRVAEPDVISIMQEGLDPGKFRFPDTESIHLTLMFLGDIEEKLAHVMCEFLRTSGFESLIVQPAKIIGLPTSKNPRTVALIVNNEQLQAYHDRICESLNLVDDRKYIPHITIARAKKGTNIRGLPVSGLDPMGPIHLQRPALYRSTLTQHGPIHEKIC